MKEKFTKTAKIAKHENADTEIMSAYLTFNMWEKNAKRRIYINDYKRRTLGYIDISNRNAVKINDRQGNTQNEIDFAINEFFAQYEI